MYFFQYPLAGYTAGCRCNIHAQEMADDDEIIRLRENIRRAAEAKVENGTLTVTDMLREITNENLARQTKALHEVQLLMNIWQLKYTLNN